MSVNELAADEVKCTKCRLLDRGVDAHHSLALTSLRQVAIDPVRDVLPRPVGWVGGDEGSPEECVR